MQENGWIKIYRKLQGKGFYRRSEYVHVWIECLLSASHKKRETMWNGKTIILNPGQFITGRKKISEKTGISESSVHRILKYLENAQQIEQQTSSTSRLITIVKWEDYQETEQQNEQRVNNERTTAEQRLNTQQELKNDKKGERERKKTATPPVFKTQKNKISDLSKSVIESRPEFAALNPMAVENVIRSAPIDQVKPAVDDFRRDMAQALRSPDNPLKLLSGYIAKAAGKQIRGGQMRMYPGEVLGLLDELRKKRSALKRFEFNHKLPADKQSEYDQLTDSIKKLEAKCCEFTDKI